ncbi:MAG: DoxX family protein [Frankiales bacterium]|nr:DoxX family protein [Frankiales bacterium]
MTDVSAPDVAALLLRLALGVTMIAHGWNHWRGGGRVEGTARWFGGLGLQPARLHAWSSIAVELGAGALLLAGLLTPIAALAVIGVMTVAAVTAHRPNGFFVFRDGYEYVVNLAVAAVALGLLGAGRLSLDDAFGIVVNGASGGAVAAAGVVAALVMLAVCWRPGRLAETAPADAPVEVS